MIRLEPVEKESLYLKISDAIYSYIRVNELQPGDKLPSERDMAAMLQTSRNSVREALRILEDRGLIYVRTGSGVFIKNAYGEESAFSIRLINCMLEELQEVQRTLDHQAVRNAIERGTKEQKEELVGLAAEMQEKHGQNIYSHTLDHSFHKKLYEMNGNSAMHQIIDSIRANRFQRRVSAEQDNDAVWLATVPEHLDLAQAILRGDEEAALAAIDIINEFGFRLK